MNFSKWRVFQKPLQILAIFFLPLIISAYSGETVQPVKGGTAQIFEPGKFSTPEGQEYGVTFITLEEFGI